MQLIEQPFVTRDEILGVLRPGEAASDSPLRTLRRQRAASHGLRIPFRSARGQVLGRLHLYNALNGDAARAYRLGRVDTAREFAAKASELEGSDASSYLTEVAATAASRFEREQVSAAGFTRYVESRRRTALTDVAHQELAREWLTQVESWIPFVGDDLDMLEAACLQLWTEAEDIREKLDGTTANSLSTFFGVVARMDRTAAELESGDGPPVLLPRDELERSGLASIGQPVALLREALPGGGTYLVPRRAVTIGWRDPTPSQSPFDLDVSQSVATLATLDPADSAWVERELARDPTAVPVAPLPVRSPAP